MASVQAPKEQAAAHPAQWLISQVNVPSLDATLESARTAPPKGYMISQSGDLSAIVGHAPCRETLLIVKLSGIEDRERACGLLLSFFDVIIQ